MPLLEPIHIWQKCHGCGMRPIVGKRFECQDCPVGSQTSLCERCYERYTAGLVEHPPEDNGVVHFPCLPHRFAATMGSVASEYGRWLEVPDAKATSLFTPRGRVARPEFCCEKESYYGTCAFSIRQENGDSPIVLTALHVMDELIRHKHVDCHPKNTNYTGRELPRLIKKVTLYDLSTTQWFLAPLGEAMPMLILPNARTGEKEPYSWRDIAGFRASVFLNLSPMSLAKNSPSAGDPIWLVGGDGERNWTSPGAQATIVEITDQMLIFRFRETETSWRGSSGAPLVNASNEVVGINTGAGFFQGKRFGHGNPLVSIRNHLDRRIER